MSPCDDNMTFYEIYMARIQLVDVCIRDDELKKWAREEARILMDDLKQKESLKNFSNAFSSTL